MQMYICTLKLSHYFNKYIYLHINWKSTSVCFIQYVLSHHSRTALRQLSNNSGGRARALASYVLWRYMRKCPALHVIAYIKHWHVHAPCRAVCIAVGTHLARRCSGWCQIYYFFLLIFSIVEHVIIHARCSVIRFVKWHLNRKACEPTWAGVQPLSLCMRTHQSTADTNSTHTHTRARDLCVRCERAHAAQYSLNRIAAAGSSSSSSSPPMFAAAGCLPAGARSGRIHVHMRTHTNAM